MTGKLSIQFPFRISGIGYYLPPKIETAAELSEKMNRSKEWIERRTGVLEKRISEIDVDQMGALAAQKALGDGPPPDLILNASGVPKQAIPDTSAFMQKALGYDGIPSFTIHATCLSFLVALKTAVSFLNDGSYRRILIISADRGTRGRNLAEPESAALLGDAAAAVLVEPAQPDLKTGLVHWAMKTYPSGAELTQIRGGGTHLPMHDPAVKLEDYLFTMQGPRIYKLARKHVYDLLTEIQSATGLSKEDIDFVIPHQASGYGVEAYVKYGGFKEEKVQNVIGRTGNCVAASIPLALALAFEEDKIHAGDRVLLIGTGAGLSVAAALLQL